MFGLVYTLGSLGLGIQVGLYHRIGYSEYRYGESIRLRLCLSLSSILGKSYTGAAERKK